MIHEVREFGAYLANLGRKCLKQEIHNGNFDSYPLPCIDELTDQLGNARYFSKLDLMKGY